MFGMSFGKEAAPKAETLADKIHRVEIEISGTKMRMEKITTDPAFNEELTGEEYRMLEKRLAEQEAALAELRAQEGGTEAV